MQAIGRKGGSRSPLTKLRKEADEGLREQAREVLSRALAGEVVDKAQLDAARSLFAYRPTEAPRHDEREVRFPNLDPAADRAGSRGPAFLAERVA
jgi:hypothetical protein